MHLISLPGKFGAIALTGCPLSTKFPSFRGWTSLNEQVESDKEKKKEKKQRERERGSRGVTRDFPTITRYLSSFEGRTTAAGGRGVGWFRWVLLPLGKIPPFRHPRNTNQFRRVLRLHALPGRAGIRLFSPCPPSSSRHRRATTLWRNVATRSIMATATQKRRFFRVGVALPRRSRSSFCSRRMWLPIEYLLRAGIFFLVFSFRSSFSPVSARFVISFRFRAREREREKGNDRPFRTIVENVAMRRARFKLNANLPLSSSLDIRLCTWTGQVERATFAAGGA